MMNPMHILPTLLIAAKLATMTSSTAYASSGQGNVRSIWVAPNSPYVMFDLSTPIHELHRCNKLERFSIDLRLESGRASFETLLLAKSHNLTISVQGLNTCNFYDAENVKNMIVN
jgi:hypothetical protein